MPFSAAEKGEKKKKVGNPNGDPVRGRDAPINVLSVKICGFSLQCENEKVQRNRSSNTLTLTGRGSLKAGSNAVLILPRVLLIIASPRLLPPSRMLGGTYFPPPPPPPAAGLVGASVAVAGASSPGKPSFFLSPSSAS